MHEPINKIDALQVLHSLINQVSSKAKWVYDWIFSSTCSTDPPPPPPQYERDAASLKYSTLYRSDVLPTLLHASKLTSIRSSTGIHHSISWVINYTGWPRKNNGILPTILFSISLGLAHFQALLTVSIPATSLNICNTEMYNDNLNKYLDQCSFIVECTIIRWIIFLLMILSMFLFATLYYVIFIPPHTRSV